MFQTCSLSRVRQGSGSSAEPARPSPTPSEDDWICPSGARFCTHHDPAKFTGLQCAATKRDGKRCRVFSGSAYVHAQPLRDDEKYCLHHLNIIRCAATKQNGARCCVTSFQVHAHAQPLRDGKKYCLHHQQLDSTAEPAAAEPAAAEPPAADPPAAEPAAAKSAAAEPMAAEPTSIEPTLDHTTALGGGDYDYDQTYDDIGGIYDSCDDYNYDSDPADDI